MKKNDYKTVEILEEKKYSRETLVEMIYNSLILIFLSGLFFMFLLTVVMIVVNLFDPILLPNNGSIIIIISLVIQYLLLTLIFVWTLTPTKKPTNKIKLVKMREVGE